MLADLRYALRTFQRTPGPVILCILALALGIGANTALFSVVKTVLLKPLNYRDPSRIMFLAEKPQQTEQTGESVSPANYLDWRRAASSFTDMAAAVSWSATFTGSGAPEEIPAMQVSGNLFRLLGSPPFLGRTIGPTDEEASAPRTAVLSYGLWQRRFGGNRNVIGRAAILSGEPFIIAGVMPPDFRFAPYWNTRAQMWVNLRFDPAFSGNRRARMLRVFARLKDETSPTQASAEMTALGTRLRNAYPADNAGSTVSVTPLDEKVVGKVRLALLVLMSAAGLVLLIACASAAHLLLARAAARHQEIAVRLALGAGRAQIIRQMLTESLLLSVTGAVAGIALASFAIQALAAGLSRADDFSLLPRFDEIQIDDGVLAFTALLAVLTGVLFGLVPAWFGARTGVLNLQTRGDLSKNAGRSWTVTAQVALAQILLIGALLLVRSFWNLQELDPGFEPAQVIAADVRVTGSTDPTAKFLQMVEKVSHLPGVQSASATNHLPLAGDVWTLDITIEGRAAPPPGQEATAVYRLSMPRYFETIGSPLRRGRDFTAADRAGAPLVAIINESMAQRYWPKEEALGRRFRMGTQPTQRPQWMTVIGISRDLKQGTWAAPTQPEMHLSALQPPSGIQSNAGASMALVVRTPVDAQGILPALRAAVWTVDPAAPVSGETTLTRAIATATWRPRLNTIILAAFAGLALVLALIGVYGVVSFAVTERRPEIGLRMALGADGVRVARLVIGNAARLVAFGLALGWIGAFVLARALEGMLYEVNAHDAVIFAAVPALLLAAALAAAAWPAWRASRLDPLECLR